MATDYSLSTGYPDVSNFGDYSDETCAPCKDYTGAKGSWCGRKWKKKADQLANEILFHWGLVKETSGVYTGYYKCAFWNKSRRYSLKGYEVTPEETRAALNCDSIETYRDVAFRLANDASDRCGNDLFGGKNCKNAKIDEWKWSKVAKHLQIATSISNNSYETCVEMEAMEDTQATKDALGAILESTPEPMSNGTLALIVGGGSAAMMYVIYKISK
tara:strand:- start:620 stop:1267 length:648 start_codon:yes stop_codon:yes gene_type:complete